MRLLWMSHSPPWPRTSTLLTMTYRPAIRPGAAVLRRDGSHLQIGTSPGVVLADRPGLLAFLRLIDGVRDVERLSALATATIPDLRDDVQALLRELELAGVMFDASAWQFPRSPALSSEARHASVAGLDPGALTRRGSFRVALHSDAATRPLATAVEHLLDDCGIAAVDHADPELLVLIGGGEPSRRVAESPMRRGVDHLWVVVDEDRIRLGPFVRPGLTPCLGCHDRTRADWDRAWPGLVDQFGRHSATITPGATSALVRASAAVEIAAEVLARCDRLPVRTAGHLLVVGPQHGERTAWPVSFHHGCDCALLPAA